MCLFRLALSTHPPTWSDIGVFSRLGKTWVALYYAVVPIATAAAAADGAGSV